MRGDFQFTSEDAERTSRLIDTLRRGTQELRSIIEQSRATIEQSRDIIDHAAARIAGPFGRSGQQQMIGA